MTPSKVELLESGVAKALNATGFTPAEVVEALKDGVPITYDDLTILVTPYALADARAEWQRLKRVEPAFTDRMVAAIEPTLAKRCRRALNKHRPPPSQEFLDDLVQDLKLWHVATQN